MIDDETMAHFLPVDLCVSAPIAKAPSGRREIWHWGDDAAFHLSACNQMAQPIFHEHAMSGLLKVWEQRRKGQ
jgi:hypothetical protein